MRFSISSRKGSSRWKRECGSPAIPSSSRGLSRSCLRTTDGRGEAEGDRRSQGAGEARAPRRGGGAAQPSGSLRRGGANSFRPAPIWGGGGAADARTRGDRRAGAGASGGRQKIGLDGCRLLRQGGAQLGS